MPVVQPHAPWSTNVYRDNYYNYHGLRLSVASRKNTESCYILNFWNLIGLISKTLFPGIPYSTLKHTRIFWTTLQILYTITPLLLEIAAVSMPFVLGGSLYLYNEIVFLTNGRYSFALANNCARMWIRGSESHVFHPMQHPVLSRIYLEFQFQHLDGARRNIEIPSYVGVDGRVRLYYNSNTWAAYNLHRDIDYILTTGDSFNRWGSDFQTRRAEERFKVVTTNQIWNNRSEADFERLDISRFALRRIINHTYIEQLKEMKTSLYIDTFKNQPAAYNYFKFGC